MFNCSTACMKTEILEREASVGHKENKLGQQVKLNYMYVSFKFNTSLLSLQLNEQHFVEFICKNKQKNTVFCLERDFLHTANSV